MKIRVQSFQSLGTKDGPGIRFVTFLSGCPMRCLWCHNPETHSPSGGTAYTPSELCSQILSCREYFGRDGGAAFSGGEPLFQAEALLPLFKKLKELSIHIVLDTAGFALTEHVKEILSLCDLVLFCLKGLDEEEYRSNAKGSYSQALAFLKELQNQDKQTVLRYLLVPGLTDTRDQLLKLKNLSGQYPCVKDVELLRFRKLCLEKYQEMGMEFPLRHIDELSAEALSDYRTLFQNL